MAFDSKKIEDFSGVWVFCEQNGGKLSETAFELLSEGRKLADEIGTELTGVVFGDENISSVTTQISEFAADKVIVCAAEGLKEYRTLAYTKVLCDLIEENKPEIMLIGATKLGRDLAPRIAGKLKTGLTADCTHLDISMENYVEFLKNNSSADVSKFAGKMDDRSLKMTRPTFGGHLMATIVCPETRPCLATIRPGVMKKAENPKQKADCKITILNPEIPEDPNYQIIETVNELRKKVDLANAEVIVSIGRGASSDYDKAKKLAQELADALGGGTVGCTRAVAETGEVDESAQIGQTGKTVRPKIYVALGISGAVQHTAGMKDSSVIIAVNKDKNAPIFGIADYGICGDLFETAQQMIDCLKK